MDESGCLGFDFSKEKTSKFFIITFLFVNNEAPIQKIVKKIVGGLHKKGKKIFTGVLHSSNQEDSVRIKLLTEVAKHDVHVMCIYVEKKRIFTDFQNEKAVLYNYITNILLDRILTKDLIEKDNIQLIASRRETNKYLNENFQSYITNQVKLKHDIVIPIPKIIPPRDDKCLQIVDFISRSIFRKYEFEDHSFYNYIKSLIIEEKSLF